MNLWTAEEDQQLRSLRARGQTFSAIAPIIGRTKGACDARHRYLSIPLPKRREERRLKGNSKQYRGPQVEMQAMKNACLPWSKQDDQLLIEENRKGIPYPEIARSMQRTVNSVKWRVRIIDPTGYRRMVATPWTAEETDLAEQMLNRDATDAEFRLALGRSKEGCKQRLDRVRYRMQVNKHNYTSTVSIPAHVIDDRDRRLTAERSLTAILMGDPPAGYSALERRA